MAEQRPRAAVRGGRRDGGHRQAADPHRALRPHGSQERDHGAEALGSGQPRPGDPRPLQPRRRLPPEQGVWRRLPRPAERQPRVLRSPRWQDRLAARPGWRPPPDRAAARRLPGGRRVAALRRRQLLRDRAGDPGRAPLRNVRRPLAERRRDGHVLHADDQRRQGTAHPRRRRPADELAGDVFPYLAAPTPAPFPVDVSDLIPGAVGIMTAEATMTAPATETLELDDIQAGA